MESLVKMFLSVLSDFTGGQCQGGGSLCYTGTNDPHPQASVILWWQAPYRSTEPDAGLEIMNSEIVT